MVPVLFPTKSDPTDEDSDDPDLYYPSACTHQELKSYRASNNTYYKAVWVTDITYCCDSQKLHSDDL